MAEGIESEHHVRVAQAMGATLGQGWYYGPPKPTPTKQPAPSHAINLLPVGDTPESTARRFPPPPAGAIAELASACCIH